MRLTFKRSDIFEAIAEAAIRFGISGLFLLGLAWLLWIYRGEGYTAGLILVLFVGGTTLFVRAILTTARARKVRLYKVRCPYCEAIVELVAPPEEDFPCSTCHRMVPTQDGAVLPVQQVRCGFCNTLNYYSDKTDLLLCEDCNREVPISRGDGSDSGRRIPKGFARQDDDQVYELVLVSNGGHKTEELIDTLQHMLALNRNQVKQMLDEMPLTVLSGITRRKAEMLQAQLSLKDAVAEYKPVRQ